MSSTMGCPLCATKLGGGANALFGVGGSEPRFQLWMNGKMKKEVKGVDAPEILGAIFKELGIKA